MNFRVVTPVTVHIACVTVGVEDVAVVVLAQLSVVTLENLYTALELRNMTRQLCFEDLHRR
jgi:hypothetical protein